MENKVQLIESLIESTFEYGKKSLELAKLKALYKASDAVSSAIPLAVVIVFLLFFIFFISFGFAFWLGIILGNVLFGFLITGAFYGITGLLIHFFMHDQIKKKFGDYLVKQLFK
jgi:fatty acid desaturase